MQTDTARLAPFRPARAALRNSLPKGMRYSACHLLAHVVVFMRRTNCRRSSGFELTPAALIIGRKDSGALSGRFLGDCRGGDSDGPQRSTKTSRGSTTVLCQGLNERREATASADRLPPSALDATVEPFSAAMSLPAAAVVIARRNASPLWPRTCTMTRSWLDPQRCTSAISSVGILSASLTADLPI